VKRAASDSTSTAKTRNIVYAVVQHEKGGTFRSEDKGRRGRKLGDTNPRPSYYSRFESIQQRPPDLGAGRAMFLSEDGGKTFSTQRVQNDSRRFSRHVD